MDVPGGVCAVRAGPGRAAVGPRVLREAPIKRQSSTALFHYCYQLLPVGTSSEVMMGRVFSICPSADASIRTPA